MSWYDEAVLQSLGLGRWQTAGDAVPDVAFSAGPSTATGERAKACGETPPEGGSLTLPPAPTARPV